MESIIKIGTVNLQNNKTNRSGGLREDGIDTAKLVAEHIETEKFDILGTQELTHRGLKESEMSQVAEFIKQVVIDGKDVTDDVTEFMQDFTKVHYSFDDGCEAYDYIEF